MAKVIKSPKPKTCKSCKNKFIPSRPLQFVCSGPCAYQFQKRQKENQQKQAEAKSRREWRERKAKLKPLKHWEDLTQRVVNDYIRERDKELPCISCGTWETVQWEAGHYRSRGKASHIRYNEDNISKQCHRCNVQLSGNQQQYRINLIEKIGPQRVLALESNNTPHRYTREELDSIRALYRAKLRALIKQREEAA
ncbi:Recombination protein NinG [Paramixta manurensis]|uniref:Recombination protein NinG n=1 Tax=Paramixta manurensis TaxID=2740817 RepID=A0A6M8UI11_9GAMM|nr:Recombination protein NinG [Erwiniaceae bacterium PD-1]